MCEIIEKDSHGNLTIWATEDDNIDIKPVVDFRLNEDKKTINVIEGCDRYFNSNLDYYNVTKLINGLKHMRSKMCNIEKAVGLFRMFFEMKNKKSNTNNV